MSPVPLTSEEWQEINKNLPDVTTVCDRIAQWPQVEWIHSWDFDALSRLRLSNVCFRDAAMNIYNARYALGQAVGVRQHFFARSKTERDNDHALADIRSRFYADYVPLLIYSAMEHTFKGLDM